MDISISASFYSGLSGLQLPVPKYLFPPSFENASRLSYYSSLFTSIEINSSFYKIPRAVTVAKWAAEVPDNFKFTFKLWNGITHNKGFYFSEEDVATFFNSIKPAASKKGCVLIQLPPSVGKEHLITLYKLLSYIKYTDTDNWNIAVEFRNKSWYNDSAYGVLNEFNVALVVQDIPKSSTPIINHETDFIYQRFHGPSGNYRDSYSEDLLEEYCTYIYEWMEQGKNVYVYFNNTIGDAFNNLETINKLLSEVNK
ncbi:MAG: DUF72 domain-containing protein [Bacteroidota bacterium]